MFERWGRLVYRRRWAFLVLSGLGLAVSIVGVLTAGPLEGNGNFGAQLPAGQAAKLIQSEIHPQETEAPAGSSMTIIFSSATLLATDPAFQSAVEAALAPLGGDPRVADVQTPYNIAAIAKSSWISKDQHRVQTVVSLKDSSSAAQRYLPDLLSQIHPGPLTMLATGQVPISNAFNTTLESDLQRAEYATFIITAPLLLLIFLSLVSMWLPLLVGGLSIVGGIAATGLLARFTDVSQYALNIVTLIGLAVAIDYSLFIVNRFSDELVGGASREDAIAKAMSTAGRAITFSGITVAIGLSAMLFFQGTFLASMGAAGTIVVTIAVIYGLTFLPALLSVIGPWADRLRVPVLGRRKPAGTGAWHSMAMWVMKRPLVVLVPALAVLLITGTPFLQLRMANGDVDQLPPGNQARQGYDILVSEFPGQDQTIVEAAVYYPNDSPLTSAHIGDIYDLSRRFAALPNVLKVTSIVDLDPSLSRADYQRLYSGPAAGLPPAMQQALSIGAGPHLAAFGIYTNKQYTSDEARAIVRAVRAEHVQGGQLMATNGTAFDLDIVNFILSRVPIAVLTVIAVTYLVLFLLTGSLVLPLKAVITNLFSVAASFGALVWIFQEGHFSHQLGFTAQSIDPSVPVILFSIVFGMSMDYEVLLISRIQEEYLRTGDNQAGVDGPGEERPSDHGGGGHHVHRLPRLRPCGGGDHQGDRHRPHDRRRA